jgi:hypothetical protein
MVLTASIKDSISGEVHTSERAQRCAARSRAPGLMVCARPRNQPSWRAADAFSRSRLFCLDVGILGELARVGAMTEKPGIVVDIECDDVVISAFVLHEPTGGRNIAELMGSEWTESFPVDPSTLGLEIELLSHWRHPPVGS